MNNSELIPNEAEAAGSALLGALTVNGITVTVAITAFTCMRKYVRLIYEPRSLSFFEGKRQPQLSSRLWGWPSSVLFADYRKIKTINGLDSYFFVRLLRMMVRIMLPIWLISWAVLLPLTSINTKVPGFSQGLYKFTFGNIDATYHRDRYIALLVLTWVFTIWIGWNIKYEMAHYVHVRQQYLVSPSHSSTAQARTVLVTGIPPDFLTESALTDLFSHLPGGIRKVWINRHLGDMPKIYNQRLKACQMLESAATSLLNTAIKRDRRRLRNPAKFGDAGQIFSDTELTNFVLASDRETRETLLEELVSKRKRPSHRLPLFSWMPFSIPLLGKKVDTIEWACERIHKLNTELAQRREILARDIAWTTRAEAQTSRMHNIGAENSNIVIPSLLGSIPLFGTRPIVDFSGLTYPPANGAFILFNTQVAAHMAAQALTHHEPYCMSNSLKYVEATPEDVIWKNLAINPYRRRVRLVLSRTVGIVLMIGWTIPVSIAAIASRLRSDRCTFVGFYWICNYAGKVTHFFRGVLYAVLLTVLFTFVPMMFRILARWEGTTQRTHAELSIMDRVFVFKIMNSLFLPTLSTVLFTTYQFQLEDQGSEIEGTWVPDSPANTDVAVIVQDLTASSTFFLIFIMVHGLLGTAIGFLQPVPLVKYYVKIMLFGSTPRSVYSIKYCPRMSAWGTLFPSITLLVAVTFGYSVISPLINGFAFVTFLLLYMLYKYLFTWVNDHPPSSDTGGLFFPKAIQHVFVGLYIQQVVLCALFFLPLSNNTHKRSAIEGTLMIVLIVFTTFFHHIITNSYGPLIKFLPQTLANVSRGGNAGVEQEAPTRTSSSDVKVTSYVSALASDSDQQLNEMASLLSDCIDDSDPERTATPSFTNKSCLSSPSLSARPITPEVPTEFGHPAATEEQRIIWLPKDPLGLVQEIERELTSQHILYSTEGAEMNTKGSVDVTSASPEEVRRGPMEERPPPYELDGDEKGIISLWLDDLR